MLKALLSRDTMCLIRAFVFMLGHYLSIVLMFNIDDINLIECVVCVFLENNTMFVFLTCHMMRGLCSLA